MLRTTSFIGAALLGLSAITLAGPSFAASVSTCQDVISQGDGSEFTSAIDQNSAAIIAGLQQRGVNVLDVSDWGGCVKADVKRPGGRIATEFFDPNSLQRLSRNG